MFYYFNSCDDYRDSKRSPDALDEWVKWEIHAHKRVSFVGYYVCVFCIFSPTRLLTKYVIFFIAPQNDKLNKSSRHPTSALKCSGAAGGGGWECAWVVD